MRNNGQILMPGQGQLQAMQQAQQQQYAIQQAFALENGRAIGSIAAALLGKDGAETPQKAVELACEVLFRSLATLSLPRTAEREAQIKATLAGATPDDRT